MARDDLLTTGPASERIGVGTQTLRDWARAGKIPYLVTPSGRLKFRVADLDTMIRRVEPTKQAS